MAVNLTQSARQERDETPRADGIVVKFRPETSLAEAQETVERLEALHFKFFGQGARNVQAEIGGQPLMLSPASPSDKSEPEA